MQGYIIVRAEMLLMLYLKEVKLKNTDKNNMKKEDPRNQFIYEDNEDSRNVWVCGDWFPVGSFSKTIPGFPMNRLLKTQLDYMIKNVVDDWDFTLIICGEGEVRIGKSVLAQQISTYWTWSLCHLEGIKLPHSVKDNMTFTGQDLIRVGNKLGRTYKYASLIFDEAGADLEGVKAMKSTTQAVKDYLRECGQYNMLNILVLPEFFDLPKSIAMNRSIAMINVYWCADADGTFRRGFFKFFNKPDKKKLYLYGKKDLNYSAQEATFLGQFPRLYTYNEEEYKKAKRDALKNREQTGAQELKRYEMSYALVKLCLDRTKLDFRNLARELNKYTLNVKLGDKYVPRFIRKMVRLFKDTTYDWDIELGDALGENEEDDEDEDL